MEENITNFLRQTEFCDFSRPMIQELAEKLAAGCKDDREVAVSIFYWTRDSILYRLGDWQRKASETLKEKEGTCTNKANLFVALLRFNKIPAGYVIMKVYGQEYLGPISYMFRKFVGKKSTHIYACVYLNGKWIKCDPSNDEKLCENTYHFNPTTKIVEWDGTKDAPLNINRSHIIKEDYPISNVDPWMLKKSKNAKGIQLKIANMYVKFARHHGKESSNINEFEILFKKYLKKEHPFYFYLFTVSSFLKDIQGLYLK